MKPPGVKSRVPVTKYMRTIPIRKNCPDVRVYMSYFLPENLASSFLAWKTSGYVAIVRSSKNTKNVRRFAERAIPTADAIHTANAAKKPV